MRPTLKDQIDIAELRELGEALFQGKNKTDNELRKFFKPLTWFERNFGFLYSLVHWIKEEL